MHPDLEQNSDAAIVVPLMRFTVASSANAARLGGGSLMEGVQHVGSGGAEEKRGPAPRDNYCSCYDHFTNVSYHKTRSRWSCKEN